METRLRLEGDNHRFLENITLASIVRRAIEEDLTPEADIDIYKKVSNERCEISIKLNAFHSYEGDGKITRIDEPEFIRDALRVVQRHRLIDERVHEMIEKLDLELDGTYILAHAGKPVVRVVGTPQSESMYIFRPTRVESYDGKNVFSHHPHPPETKVDLSLSIQGIKSRRIIENIFRTALNHYKDLGYHLVDESVLAQAK